MDVWSLASGSSGNAYLVRSDQTLVLVECGISLSRLTSSLARLGLKPDELNGVLLTHEHGDHILSARQLSDRHRVPLYATRGTLGHPSVRDSDLVRVVAPSRQFPLGDLEVLPFLVPHDADEPVGYRLLGQAASVCIATDLGFVPESVARRFRDNDLLVLEANHDERMVEVGPYPGFLKRRVLSQHGHLSNTSTARALVACGDRVPRRVWLAHLSQVNNTVRRARQDVATSLAGAGLNHVALDVARRNKPSLHWTSEPRLVQQALF